MVIKKNFNQKLIDHDALLKLDSAQNHLSDVNEFNEKRLKLMKERQAF